MKIRRSAPPVSAGSSAVTVGSPSSSATGSSISTRDASLIEGLVRRDVLSSDDAARVLDEHVATGRPVPELLREHGIDEDVSLDPGSPDLDAVDLGRFDIDPQVVPLIPEDFARGRLVVALREVDGVLEVAVGESNDFSLANELGALTGREVRLLGASANDVRRTIDRNYKALTDVDVLLKAFASTDRSHKRAANTEEIVSDDAPVAQLVTRILTQAIRDRASDVHIEPKESVVRVRFRVDGAMKDVLDLPSDVGPGLVSRIKIMAGMNIVERRRPQDGQLRVDLADTSVDVRVATVATIFGELCVMRILDKSRSVYQLSELGMPLDTHETYAQLARSPFGMILCVGPTGSGKTTTLYATLSEIDDSTRNVMTIEDPVEYVFPAINQIQTNEAADLTFANSLRSILRSDPDVILVGEIRDVDTARIAVQSALTGHLVLSSLHATDTVSALLRFVDMGIEPFLVSSSVLAIVAQRLVRRVCESCKVPFTPSDEELAFFRDAGGNTDGTFYRGEGCNVCAGTGYHDRIGVYELLRVTPEIKRLVATSATQDELLSVARAEGMRTLRQEVVSLVEQGVTTINEIVRAVYVA